MKKILSGITSFLLVGVLVGGVCACGYASRDKSGKWFGNSDFKSWHWSDNTDDKQSDDDKADNKPVETFTGSTLDIIEKDGIQLYSARLPRATYAANGISETADSAYTLTAEVFPDYASDKSLDWSVAWQVPDSEWASGKTVTDYVTIMPNKDGGNIAVCACLQDFGEPVNITVSSRSNPLVFGVVAVNYYQRVKSLSYSFSLDGETVNAVESNGVYKVDYTGEKKNYAVEIVPEYSAYTLTDTYSTEISGALTSTFGYTAATSLTALEIPAGLTGGDPELTENAVNWCNWVKRDEFDRSWGYEYIQMNRGLMLGNNVDAFGHILKPVYTLTAEEKAHPRCAYYISLISDNDNFANEAAFNTAKDRFNNYTPSAYTFMDNVSVANYNDFVNAVKRCNSANVGVVQYTVKVTGAYSSYETVLNLGYNDDFKIEVSDMDLSDTQIGF